MFLSLFPTLLVFSQCRNRPSPWSTFNVLLKKRYSEFALYAMHLLVVSCFLRWVMWITIRLGLARTSSPTWRPAACLLHSLHSSTCVQCWFLGESITLSSTVWRHEGQGLENEGANEQPLSLPWDVRTPKNVPSFESSHNFFTSPQTKLAKKVRRQTLIWRAIDNISAGYFYNLCVHSRSKDNEWYDSQPERPHLFHTLQGESGGLGLGYVDSVPSQDNLQMRRNWYQYNLVRDHQTHPVAVNFKCVMKFAFPSLGQSLCKKGKGSLLPHLCEISWAQGILETWSVSNELQRTLVIQRLSMGQKGIWFQDIFILKM